MSQNVFAYGSNMCSGRFHAYRVSPHGTGRPGVLLGYRLQFDKKSTADRSGKANVVAQQGSEVWGVLYTISDADKKKLDEGEGGYQPLKLPLRLEHNRTTEAWVYVARKSRKDPSLRPFTWYKRFLVEGAREHSLPQNYIAELERIEAVEDSDKERDREKRALACRAE
jgi:gamma-glutamylcyclotransferase